MVTGSLSNSFSLFWESITINSFLTIISQSLFDLSQSHIFRKTYIRLSLISLTDLMLSYNFVSSAYILIWGLVAKRGRSFMYITNNKGPRTDLCGTLYFIFRLSDHFPFTLQHFVLFPRALKEIQFIILVPYWDSFLIKI